MRLPLRAPVTGALPTLLPRAIGAGLAPGFALAARVRRGKPLHPRGVVLDARVHRHGARQRWGSPFLDEPGTDPAIVRFSASVGLPAPLPDVLGLALRFADDAGTHDLLLATTGLGRIGRYLLIPRRDAAGSAYSCLMPYRAPDGTLVLIAAVPAGGRRQRPGDPRFTLLAATPRGPWHPFADLEVAGWPGTEDGGDAGDADVAFDPVRHPLPGLAVPPALAALREPSYAAARRGRSGHGGHSAGGGRSGPP